ncbi:MAG: Rid family hydrolase [Gammaproteobacteria bacterium]
MTEPRAYVPEGTEWMENDFGMSPAIRSGDLVWLSGVTVAPQDGESLEAAIERTFKTIEKILQEAGSSWNNVIDVTSFHVDLEPQKETFLKVRAKYVTGKPYPSWTAVEVKGLWGATLVAEIKVVARAA